MYSRSCSLRRLCDSWQRSYETAEGVQGSQHLESEQVKEIRNSLRMRERFQAMTGPSSISLPLWKRLGSGATIDSSARTYSAAPPKPQIAAEPEKPVSTRCKGKAAEKRVLTGDAVSLLHLVLPLAGSLDDLTDDSLARCDRQVDADKAIAAEDLVPTRTEKRK